MAYMKDSKGHRLDTFEVPAAPDGGNVATRVLSGRMGTINLAALTTFQLTVEAPAAFDALRPIFANTDAALSRAARLVAASSPAATSDLNNSGGSWVSGTRGGLTRVYLPAAPGATERVAYETTEWISVSSVARSDSGTKPLASIRAAFSTTNGLPVYGNGTDDFTNWASRTDGHLWVARSQATDGVQTPSNFTSTTNISQSPIVGIQFLCRGAVRTVMGVGDSLTDGRGTYLGEGPILPALAGISGVEFANLGWAGQSMVTFAERAIDLLQSEITRPDVLVMPVGSPNDLGPVNGSYTITAADISAFRARRARVVAAARRAGVPVVLWTMLPVNNSVHTWGTSDSLRVAYNAECMAMAADGVQVVDLATLVSGSTSGGQVQLNAAHTADGIHLNDAGNAVAAAALAPAIAEALRRRTGNALGSIGKAAEPVFPITDSDAHVTQSGTWVYANTTTAGAWTLAAPNVSRPDHQRIRIRVRQTAKPLTITATAANFALGSQVPTLTVQPGQTVDLTFGGAALWDVHWHPTPSALDLVVTEFAGAGLGSAMSAFGTASRTLYARVRNAGVVSKVRLEVGTSAGNISVAVYRSTGSGSAAAPGTQIATSGAIACPAAGVQEVALGSTVNVEAGDWLAFSYDSTTATFRTAGVAAASSLYQPFAARQDSAHPAPASAGTLAVVSSVPVLIGVP